MDPKEEIPFINNFPLHDYVPFPENHRKIEFVNLSGTQLGKRKRDDTFDIPESKKRCIFADENFGQMVPIGVPTGIFNCSTIEFGPMIPVEECTPCFNFSNIKFNQIVLKKELSMVDEKCLEKLLDKIFNF